jgi:AraC family transcriptional regulator
VTLTRDILRLLAKVNDSRHEDVSLSAMAALAHRSPFNLHRRFRQIVGETPKAYTSRVRLARAAADLLSTDHLTSAVALNHGFAGHEVFTRAFTRHFGLNPRTYRARGLRVDDDRAVEIHAATTASVAPCVGLYRMTLAERSTSLPVDIVVKELPAVHALVISRRVSRDEIAAALSACLPLVFAYVQRHGLAMTGPPFARYPEIGMGSLVIESGFPISAPVSEEPGDGIQALTIPAGPAAVAIHRGPYERLPETYGAMEIWIQEEGRSAGGPPWETYLTDPGEHPDPQTWETEIVQPLR